MAQHLDEPEDLYGAAGLIEPLVRGQPGPVGDDARMAVLRRLAWSLRDGTDWSRVDDQGVVEQLHAFASRLPVREGRLLLQRLAPPPVAEAAAPPAPAAAPRAAPAATPPAPAAETTFGADVDVAAQVAALVQAAQDGVPFCEECERARQAAMA